jgi:hypothetical protein
MPLPDLSHEESKENIDVSMSEPSPKSPVKVISTDINEDPTPRKSDIIGNYGCESRVSLGGGAGKTYDLRKSIPSD